MNTKIVLIASCLFLAILGLVLTFIPDEIIAILEINENPISTLSLQLLGAIYLGFALTNWMSKGLLIGGIYNKPLTLGNFMHFFIGAMALIKLSLKIQDHNEVIVFLAIFYSLFALLFAYIFRTNPKEVGK